MRLIEMCRTIYSMWRHRKFTRELMSPIVNKQELRKFVGTWRDWNRFTKGEGPPEAPMEPPTVFKFDTREEIEKWKVETDQQYGGRSTAKFSLGPGGVAILEGVIDTTPSGMQARSGYIAISRVIPAKEVIFSDALELRVKTDGTPYHATVQMHRLYDSPDHAPYQHTFYGQPGRWIDVVLHYYNFMGMSQGNFDIDQEGRSLIWEQMRSFSIVVSETSGPFRLEIARVRAVALMTQNALFARRRITRRHPAMSFYPFRAWLRYYEQRRVPQSKKYEAFYKPEDDYENHKL